MENSIGDVFVERIIHRLGQVAVRQLWSPPGKVIVDLSLLQDTITLLKQMHAELRQLEDDKHHMIPLLDQRIERLEKLFQVQEVV